MTQAPYDDTNIFARILRGEIPCHRIYEDEATLAFMDVMPQTEGHCLVVPKTPARGLLDAAPDQLAAAIATTQRIARAAKEAFSADGIQVAQFNEPAAGQTVFHLHFHVMPRYHGVPLRPHSGSMADQAVLAEQAARIKAALGS
jgi:histidine triad (HIT) family protein